MVMHQLKRLHWKQLVKVTAKLFEPCLLVLQSDQMKPRLGGVFCFFELAYLRVSVSPTLRGPLFSTSR